MPESLEKWLGKQLESSGSAENIKCRDFLLSVASCLPLPAELGTLLHTKLHGNIRADLGCTLPRGEEEHDTSLQGLAADVTEEAHFNQSQSGPFLQVTRVDRT